MRLSHASAAFLAENIVTFRLGEAENKVAFEFVEGLNNIAPGKAAPTGVRNERSPFD